MLPIVDKPTLQYIIEEAIHCAKSFIGNEPFAVLLGDDIVDVDTPCLNILENQEAGKGGEIQLTDALQTLGFLEATVDFALKRDDLREEFMAFLRTKGKDNSVEENELSEVAVSAE